MRYGRRKGLKNCWYCVGTWAIRRCVLFLLLAGACVRAQSLPPELEQAWQVTQLPQDALSLVVREVGGKALFALHPDTPRNPASVMKLVTTWTALSTLGSGYSWRTNLLARHGWQVDAQGRLSEPLYIQAVGDPWMTVPDLWALLRELRLRGVRQLNDVIVDRSHFGQVAINPGDFDQSPDRPYNASPDAMLVSWGATRLLFTPDARAQQWVPIIDPPVPGVRVQGQINWLEEARCTGTRRATAQVKVSEEGVAIVLDGAVAGVCGEFSIYRLTMPQSPYFAALFRHLWQGLGGSLTGQIRDGRVPPLESTPIVWHDSRSLADTIRVVNKHSNNVMARHILLTLAAETTKADGGGATAAVGARAALAVLRKQRVPTDGWVIGNGSGLSRAGRLTAQGLADMLQVAWRSTHMPEFVSSLAIAGVDGTVQKRMQDRKTRGRAHLKTGSLRGARAVAGYVLGANGKRYIVVSLVNHAQADNAQAFHDALIRWVAAQ